LSPNVHPDLVETWSKRLPVMKRYLDENSLNEGAKAGFNFNLDQWQVNSHSIIVLKFVESIVKFGS
jgi:hypothetical protein